MDISSDKLAKSHMSGTWLRKRNLKRETVSFLTAVQINAVAINYIKAKNDNMQENSKCRLCDDKDETINHISE